MQLRIAKKKGARKHQDIRCAMFGIAARGSDRTYAVLVIRNKISDIFVYVVSVKLVIVDIAKILRANGE